MEALWTEKYRPENFEALSYHPDITSQLQSLVQQGDMPHLIFYGPEGAGKRTRVNCLLSKLYGKSVLRPTKDAFTIKNNSTIIEIAIRASKFHVELTPSDAEHNDRLVLMKLIKESASNSALVGTSKNNFMTFVLYDAENLTLGAQAALRRTLEKYANKIRIILVCESVGKIIPALKSRCLMIRLPAPKPETLLQILESVAYKEKLAFDTGKELQKIVEVSNRNLGKAITLLQACSTTNSTEDEIIQDFWKTAIYKKLFEPAMKEQSVEVVKNSRSVFFELLVNQIPADDIIKELLVRFLEAVKGETYLSQMKEIAVFCEKSLKQGERDIIYLEAFLVKILLVLKNLK